MEAQVGFLQPQSKHILLAPADRSLLKICVISVFDGPDILTEIHRVWKCFLWSVIFYFIHWNCHLYMYLQSCSQHCLYRRRSTVIHVTTRVEDLVWIIHIYFLSSRHYSYIHSSIDSAVIPILIWFDAQEKIMNIIGVSVSNRDSRERRTKSFNL